jgi:hypothetical protein
MTKDQAASQGGVAKRATERVSFYVWTAVVLVAAVVILVISWHATGGTTDPTALPQ